MTPDQSRRSVALVEMAADIDWLLATLQDTTDSQRVYEACKRVRSALR
jgi:hypothetical protein